MLGGCTEWSDCLEPTLEANTRTSKYPRFVDLLSCFLRRRLERCTLRPAASDSGWSAVALVGRDPFKPNLTDNPCSASQSCW